MSYELDDNYVDVASRIVEFRTKYPTGSLQPANPSVPFTVQTIGGQAFIAVVAAAYRTPDDPCPGIGMAYEQVPGKTPYTRGSELQNAETAAWGRAIVAALASDTRKGVASAEDVRNRRAEGVLEPTIRPEPAPSNADELREQIRNLATARKIPLEVVAFDFHARTKESLKETANLTLLSHYAGHLRTGGQVIPKAAVP